MSDSEYVDAAEAAAAFDPAIGDGTPDSAPHLAPFDDDAYEADVAGGGAEDDDDVEDDDDSPIEADL